jgi:hypothetical protein
VGTHSTLRPIHGGQLRSYNIGRALEANGYMVRGIAACFRQAHDIVNERECILDIYKARMWKGSVCRGSFSDYFMLHTVNDDPELRAEFFRYSGAVRSDIIMLEHPWLWPLVRLLPDVASGHVPVVYNSQNVEAHLKHKIVADLKLDETEMGVARPLLTAVDEFEREVVTSVKAVTACTTEDAAVFDAWGARRTMVAGNGSRRPVGTGLRRPFPASLPEGARYAFMVGSGHPPNVTGFENLVLPWLSKLRPGQRVVVAGGASDWIRNRLIETGIADALEGRLVLLGHVSDLALSVLIENAACIMLPIEYGGGSNLKTAEALLSDRRVVASAAAMRGFEPYRDLPGLTIVDGQADFCTAVLAALEDGSPAPRPFASVKALTWEAMLAPIVLLVDSLLECSSVA